MQVSHLHGFLASVFRSELSVEFLRQLRSEELRKTLAAAGVDLQDELLDGPEAMALEALAVEYAALFLGPGGHISPHESVQVDEENNTLWGDDTVAVRTYIEAVGFKYEGSYKGIPDHISVELEFMAELARRESQAWEAEDYAAAENALAFQSEFMREHLGRWVGTFCDKVIAGAHLPFYRDIARLMGDFLQTESKEIEQRLSVARRT